MHDLIVPEYRYNKVSSEQAFEFSSAGEGFFAQDDPKTDDNAYDEKKHDFGLIKDSWETLMKDFEQLRKEADTNTRYKLLFLGRHGQGYHNLAILKYGQEAWDEKWSKLNGDGETVWGPDPELTGLGVQQAKDNNTAWKEQLPKGIPKPEIFYVSPFIRAIDTMQYTFDDIFLNVGNPRVSPPLVVEDLREDNGEHTCDSRSKKSQLAARFPRVVFEDGFPEDDETWRPDWRESFEEHKVRTRRFLNKLFALDWDEPLEKQAKYVSVTSHSGTIATFLGCIGHREFSLGTGGMIPVIVKSTKRS